MCANLSEMTAMLDKQEYFLCEYLCNAFIYLMIQCTEGCDFSLSTQFTYIHICLLFREFYGHECFPLTWNCGCVYLFNINTRLCVQEPH